MEVRLLSITALTLIKLLAYTQSEHLKFLRRPILQQGLLLDSLTSSRLRPETLTDTVHLVLK